METRKVVLITGSSKGLGKAIALQFAKEGCIVILNCKDSIEEANNLKNSLELIGNKVDLIAGDITNKETAKSIIKEIITKYGRLDILVNNAGIFKKQEEITDENEILLFKTKIIAIQILSDEAISAGVKSIINISSIYGINPDFDSRLISTLQTGVIAMTKAYAKKYVGKIQINAIAPGWMDTDRVKSNYDAKFLQKIIEEKLPIKRLIDPKEIAEISSPIIKSPLITGQTIITDGGYHLIN